MKKLSELMLEGYAMVGERQGVDAYCVGNPKMPDAVCAIGAARLAESGSACHPSRNIGVQVDAFFLAVGISVNQLNDSGMSIPDIAGIAAAEGL